jgi:endonuclease/exonuclease/phosphatase (EEP) superfamily protein YafD
MWRPAIAGSLLVLFAGWPLLQVYTWEGAPGPLHLYQKNMLFKNDDLAGLQADIRQANLDVVTLQEVSRVNEGMLTELSDVLPHQVLCPFSAIGGVAVLTRLVPITGQVRCAQGVAAIRVEGPEGPLWLVSVHLHWPWPYRQAEQLHTLLPLFAELEGPVVIAGDFNMVRWSAALSQVRAAARVQNAGPVRASYAGFGPLALLPIDQVLAPQGGRVRLRPELGSDHRGMLADLHVKP